MYPVKKYLVGVVWVEFMTTSKVGQHKRCVGGAVLKGVRGNTEYKNSHSQNIILYRYISRYTCKRWDEERVTCD